MFRKKQKFSPSAPCPVPIIEQVSTPTFVDGDVVTVLESKVVDTCSDEYLNRIPDPAEYTLEYCLAAGITLDVIKASNLLSPTDIADLEFNGAAISESTFNQLVSLKDN